MHIGVKSGIVILASGLLLGCGSSEGDSGPSISDARAPAVLDGASDAAVAASYINVMSVINAAVGELGEFNPLVASKLYASASKLKVEDDCDDGNGRFEYDDETADETVVIDFHSCQLDGAVLNGTLSLECLNGSFDDESCVSEQVTFGDQGGEIRVVEGSEVFRIGGIWKFTENGAFETIAQTLQARISRGDTLQAAYVADDFELDIDYSAGTNPLIMLNGDLGLVAIGDDVDCGLGGMLTFTTLTQIALDDSGDPVSGRIRLNTADSQVAQVEFLGNGDLSVTVNGSTSTVTQAQYQGLCAVNG